MASTILLVEDNPDDEALTLRTLRRHNVTNDVVSVRDGAAALDYLFGRGAYAGPHRPELPRLILLDLKLPKVTGLDVLKAVRSHPETRLTPVVMLTSSREERDLVASYQHGVNSYVAKPVEFTAFAEAVRQLGIYWTLINEQAPRTSGLTA